MTYSSVSPASSGQLLRTALWIDAVVSGACALVQVAATQTVHQLTGLGIALLTSTGWFMLAYAVFLSFMARHQRPPSGFVWLLVVGNPVWGIASAILLSQLHATLTPAGIAYLVVNTLFVFGIAAMQYLGLQQRNASAT